MVGLLPVYVFRHLYHKTPAFVTGIVPIVSNLRAERSRFDSTAGAEIFTFSLSVVKGSMCEADPAVRC